MRYALTLLPLALFAGAPLPAQVAPARNGYNERLAKLPDLTRRSVLRRALRDSGQSCNRVDLAVPGGVYKNLLMWSARCATYDYGVFIGPDGTAQASRCETHPRLGLPACRLPPRRR